ncbi:PaaX family transcriptional regulator C-terminal domain-containing protein [Microbacterium sp. SSM24]|uniref:PaaX family transcriptional regulator n=1 Tax=Microbacterium sp. SSM24 TaxID=2991714 RepID=UPI002226810C|nr:PaaX family transcriptional regulator C-terminal domain-containing protein [Microbacterium sp. SSM24]MCW3492604.1 PaaX family transcriptional regulator [Microbacterium sp. SSM24]
MGANTARTLLVTLLGAFSRRVGNWLPVAAMVELLEEVGADESSIRTSVSRLKRRGWLVQERRGGRNGYSLTPLAVEALDAGDRVIWHARQHAELADGWCVANVSVPEREREKRHLLRSRLAGLGFGNIGQGLWLAPARMRAEALEVIDALDLRDYTNVFVGRYEGGQELIRMVRSGWDLDHLDGLYREFVTGHQPDLDHFLEMRGSDIPPREAFARYMLALDDWRTLPLRDPGLPRELLRRDWAGDAATRLMERIVLRLESPALAYVRDMIDR